MYWKTPPEIPGFISHNCIYARAVFGSCDMNENHGTLEKLDPSVIPPEKYELCGETYLFHRTEVLGDLLSHVYLHDEGKVPVSIQANDFLAQIHASTDRDDIEKQNAIDQLFEAVQTHFDERARALPDIRAQMKAELEMLKPIEIGVEIEGPKTPIVSRIMSFFNGGANK